MTKRRKAPEGVLDQRPALRDDPAAAAIHPENGSPPGNPPMRYTPAMHDRIVQEIRAGNRPHVAAGIAGITSSTFHEWLRRGKDGDPHLFQFAVDVELALAQAEGFAIETVRKAMLDDPEYAKWWLERARSDGYAKQIRMQVDQALVEFLNRLEHALDQSTFERVLSVYAGAYTPDAEKPVH